ncbi:hypothetical protein [Dyadobacter pollutisoli]|jgi:hypothetical protein|uniref:Uncharacterized protein n=1 Tax=Dyadobacter pollutisoli TaxID=2910158 RepID=A0A9E8NCC4_9BACT|nr:hypothetical protein [Dyadobacter pollutisoli]WAC14000.1 hypothetical protein ON006_08555 [Dyadobacter pollutisoli]
MNITMGDKSGENGLVAGYLDVAAYLNAIESPAAGFRWRSLI